MYVRLTDVPRKPPRRTSIGARPRRLRLPAPQRTTNASPTSERDVGRVRDLRDGRATGVRRGAIGPPIAPASVAKQERHRALSPSMHPDTVPVIPRHQQRTPAFARQANVAEPTSRMLAPDEDQASAGARSTPFSLLHWGRSNSAAVTARVHAAANLRSRDRTGPTGPNTRNGIRTNVRCVQPPRIRSRP
jgi:hypothetical protein